KVAHLTMGALVSGYVGIAITAFACLYSWLLLLNTAGVIAIAPPLQPGSITVFSYEWFMQGPLNYVISFQLDRLAIVMMVVVTTISLLVQFYSQGYMENSAGYARFFAYLTLFTFSMLDITFAENFLVIFVGWELVGLSSYLLIGFWINKKAKPNEDRLSPASASIEAFIANRVGDVGFIIGIMILFANTGTFKFSAITAIYAASIALVQYDFKRVLAFSTISQLGYMFVGLGVAGQEYGPGPGMFHLFTHAFFKALLFLGAGSVLHGLHHAMHREVQDVRLMGGLARWMPITSITWLVA